MKKSLFLAIALAISTCGPHPASAPPSPSAIATPSFSPAPAANWPLTATAYVRKADLDFEQLVERVKAQDPTVDFTEFRLAFARTSHYDPYGFENSELRDQMVNASDAGRFDHALELANEFLRQNYIFPEAHNVAIRANDALGRSQDADFHRYVLNGLIESILASGDGKTPQSAYEIVLIEEEYLILEVKGVRDPVNREEFVEGCDVFDGVDPASGQPIRLYFNARIPIQSFFNASPGFNGGDVWSRGC